jgi:hypothetical protein
MCSLHELLFRVRHEWHLPTLLAVALLLVPFVLLVRDPLYLEQGGGQPVEARITRMSTLGSRYQGRWPGLHVYAKTKDGMIGQTTALPPDLAGCKIGDRIEATQSGTNLYLKAHPCQ